MPVLCTGKMNATDDVSNSVRIGDIIVIDDFDNNI